MDHFNQLMPFNLFELSLILDTSGQQRSALEFLADLDQHAVCGFWMQESNKKIVGARAGSFVDELEAGELESGQLLFNVIHEE